MQIGKCCVHNSSLFAKYYPISFERDTLFLWLANTFISISYFESGNVHKTKHAIEIRIHKGINI